MRLRYIIALICGVILASLSAMSFSLWSPFSTANVAAREWVFDPAPGWPLQPNSDADELSFGPGLEFATATWRGPRGDRRTYTQFRYRSGWPFRSMQASLEYTGTPVPAASDNIHPSWNWRDGFAPPYWFTQQSDRIPRRLPSRVLWVGMVANTVFFAAAICALIALLEALRRWWRWIHHRCPCCAYVLQHGTTRCPECGAVLRERPV